VRNSGYLQSFGCLKCPEKEQDVLACYVCDFSESDSEFCRLRLQVNDVSASAAQEVCVLYYFDRAHLWWLVQCSFLPHGAKNVD
jgi:hypothetical protein